MSTALSNGGVDPARLVAVFSRYMKEGGCHVTRAAFEENLAAKLDDQRFLSDIRPLLAVGWDWNANEAAALVMETLCPLLAGEPWKRTV